MESIDDTLTAKIAELKKITKDLNQAKDEATQSWLDSRPLIDELEKMQAQLANTKVSVTKSNTTISQIQAQIATTHMCTKSTKEAELKLLMTINEKNQDLHTTQEEMEQIKLKIDQKRRRRLRLKQELKIKKHTLRTLELTYVAIKLESEAFGETEAEALRHIGNSEEDVDVMVRLSEEEYDLLKRVFRENCNLAEWRISVAVEEKVAAEKNRDSAFRRMEKLYHRNLKEKTPGNKAPAKSPAGVGERKLKRELKNDEDGGVIKKKKTSFCVRIKRFFVRKLSKYFK